LILLGVVEKPNPILGGRDAATNDTTVHSHLFRRKAESTFVPLICSWKMELKKVMKDKKFWFASFLITWAAALQVTMT
jgi:hypothetical protein